MNGVVESSVLNYFKWYSADDNAFQKYEHFAVIQLFITYTIVVDMRRAAAATGAAETIFA